MAFRLLDDCSKPANWTAKSPDGQAPAQITISAVSTALRNDGSASRVRLDASPGSLHHFASLSLTASDVTGFNELRLWVQANRTADGTSGRPFFARLEMGSAELPVGTAQNTWFRFVPVRQAGAWECVLVHLDELDGRVKKALTELRLTSIDGTASWSLILDGIFARTEQIAADVPEAFRTLLDGRIKVNGNPVPAVVTNPGGAAAQLPNIAVSLVTIQPADMFARASDYQTDYTDKGSLAWPPNDLYAVVLQVDAAAANAADRGVLLDEALREFNLLRRLNVGGLDLPVQYVPPNPEFLPPALPQLQVLAWKTNAAGARRVTPVREITVNAEPQAPQA
ncbi:MAG: hypothetical protein U0Q18_27625 [Bryobacteraceae bacterium]